MQEEFYIGWQAEAPPSFVKTVRRFVTGLCILVPALALLIVLFQKSFSNGTFEYGKTTVLEGVFNQNPVPFLTIENGKDLAGKPVFQKILLVGEGKFGFAANNPQQAINGQKIQVSGTLIYNDGKTALQVEAIESRGAVNHSPVAGDLPQAMQYLVPKLTLRGEITDPKCLFGVMNPGRGKPHRDCAVRCIAGGIPPVLKVTGGGEAEYYLLTGPDGEAINEQILKFVGDGVQVCGRLEQEDDWLVLYTDPGSIQRINKGALNAGVSCN